MSGSQARADNLLVRACGYYVRDRSGGFCRQRMVSGIAYSSVFHAGVPMASGRSSSAIFLKPLIYRMFLWTDRWLGRMLARLGRQTALPIMRHWVVPKMVLAVRSTRICDALGMPIKYILTGGQEAECKQAIPLLENVKASAVLADKAYDTNELRAWLECRGIKAVIPPKSNRKETIECYYKERHVVDWQAQALPQNCHSIREKSC